MKNKELLEKLTHNRVLLFLLPNFIYMSRFLAIYNNNFTIDYINEILFREVIFCSVIFFVITLVIYLLISFLIRDKQKVFLILCFICCFYFMEYNLIGFMLFVMFILLLIVIMKKFIRFRLDSGIFICYFVIIYLFGYSFIVGCYNLGYYFMNSSSYSLDREFVIEEDSASPNIYWIHCDAMMSMESMSKYFGYSDSYFRDYLDSNNYYVNENAEMVVGHHTNTALVALFNPSYYDEFFKDYLTSLEDDFLNNSKRGYSIVSYDELKDKRFNNEVFNALEEKGYSTYAIAEFNQYSSLMVDYYYDYYFYSDSGSSLEDGDGEFRDISNNSDIRLSLMSDLVHFKYFINRSMVGDLVKDIDILDYDVIDYDSMDVSDYYYIDNTYYWVAKAIVKGLDLSMDSDSNNFVFVDYKLNHLPMTFDINGNVLDDSNYNNVSYYLGNYIYSTYLLVDILEFIKDNDEDGIIILQGDHGLHSLRSDWMMDYFDIDMEGVEEIRNSVISAIYIPDKYKNDDDIYLNNPLNISRYIVNNYVGENYEYIE